MEERNETNEVPQGNEATTEESREPVQSQQDVVENITEEELQLMELEITVEKKKELIYRRKNSWMIYRN